MRSTLLNSRMSIDIALYHMIIKDKSVDLKINNFGGKKNFNAAKTKQKGLEILSTYAPVHWARVNLAYTYAENKYEDFIDPIAGNAIILTASLQINTMCTY